jgi:G2/mitotic-specific cyclin 1/2
VSNENDENSSTRVTTRAKSAALADKGTMPAKGAVKRATVSTAASRAGRSALGDVSNVNKVDEGKKATGKVGLVSKASHPSGVQKSTARPASRAALASKDATKKPRSGYGSIGGTQKRKAAEAAEKAVSKDENEALVEPKEKPQEPKSKPQPPQPDPLGIDDDDMEDPLMVSEYVVEIFEYLRDLEVKSIPNPEYMRHQDELEWSTRGILIDWLIEVHTRFHLLPETLFLAVNIVDRFLSEKVVQLDNFQLVGITAMFIASKYEEILSPYIGNFKRITNDGFTESEILSAERFVLSTLEYDLSYPNPMNFLRRVSKADNYDIQSRTIGKYLMEISLLDHRFMEYRPSHVAAAAMYLARLMLDRGAWVSFASALPGFNHSNTLQDDTLAYYAGYTEDEVEPVVHLMVDYLARPVVHEAFFKKYANKKFLKGVYCLLERPLSSN